MAQAMECDRCKKLYKPKVYDPEANYIIGRPIIKITIHTFGISKDFDVCQSCAEEFRYYFGEDITTLK